MLVIDKYLHIASKPKFALAYWFYIVSYYNVSLTFSTAYVGGYNDR